MSKYRIIKKNSRKAIFDLNGNQISKWWNDISKYGLVEDTSDYYIVKNGISYAIFHKDNPEKPVSR